MAATVAGALAVPFLAGFLKPDASESSSMGLILNLNLVMVLVWGDWLVSREKTKGTIGWLRTLPVPEGTIIIAKVATYMLGCVLLWVTSTLLYVPHYVFPGHWREWIALQCLLIFAGTVSVCGRFRFRQKLAQVQPLIVIGVPLALHLILLRTAPSAAARLAGIASQPMMVTAGAVALIGASACVIWGVGVWMRRAETFELSE
jgi:hypothetical protein